MNQALPQISAAVQNDELEFLWIYLSHAAYEATDLDKIPPAHDNVEPLSDMPRHQQDKILKNIAVQIKEAALGATEPFNRASRMQEPPS